MEELLHLCFEAFCEEYVGGLDVPVDDPSPALLVQVVKPPGGAHRDVEAQLPSYRRGIRICNTEKIEF